MSKSCPKKLLNAFLKQGAGAEIPMSLARHVESCATCERELEAAISLRELVAPIAADGMDRQRADEMRFVLMEGARVPRRSGNKRRAIAAAAAVLFAFVGLSGAMALYVAVKEPARVEEAPNPARLKRVRPDPADDPQEREPVLVPEGEDLEQPVESPARVLTDETAAGTTTPEPSAERLDPDAAFVDGWRAFRGGRYRRAAIAFDRLSRSSRIDAARRGEVLYWAARSHEARGASERAASRYQRSLQVAPSGWWRADARARRQALSR